MEIVREVTPSRFIFLLSTMRKPFVVLLYIDDVLFDGYIVFGRNEDGVVVYKTIMTQKEVEKIYRITYNVVAPSGVYNIR